MTKPERSVTRNGAFCGNDLTNTVWRHGFLNARGGTVRPGFEEAGSLSLDNTRLVSLSRFSTVFNHSDTLEILGEQLSLIGGIELNGVLHDLQYTGEVSSGFVAGLRVHQYVFSGLAVFQSGTDYTVKLKKADGTYLQWGIQKVTLSESVSTVGGGRSAPDFISAQLAPPVNDGIVSVAHGLNANPSEIWAYLQCVEASNGYAVGRRISLETTLNHSGSTGASISSDLTKVYFKINIGGFSLLDDRTFRGSFNVTTSALTRAKWRLVLLANR